MENSLFDISQYEKTKPKKINRRNFDFDFIYTDSTDIGLCCIAIQSGLKYGLQSGFNGCSRVGKYRGRHDVLFVDCNYRKYDHEKHLASVKEFEPKYATVRDIMNKQQCKEADIEYFSFNQIMNYAWELNKYAENVILIPKIDVIDKIPAEFMLGYSIPTSHGGTTIPIERFADHKTHLLGGSWKKQLNYIERYNYVVSCDNNYIHLVSRYGNFCYPNGEIGRLKDIGLNPPSQLHVCTVISFGSVAEKLFEIFGENNA